MSDRGRNGKGSVSERGRNGANEPDALRLRRTAVVVSCEHASNRVPPEARDLLRCSARFLATHRGYDPGSLPVAQRLARRFDAPLFAGTVTRLAVDLNRPEDSSELFSSFLRWATPQERARLLERYHRRHWQRVREAVEARCARGGPVLHLSIHSFTPVMRGERRRADIGFLFDPERAAEHAFCEAWRRELERELVRHGLVLCLMHNSPYSGTAPALTTSLRAELPPRSYLGVELEINQRLWRRRGARWEAMVAALEQSLDRVVGPAVTPVLSSSARGRPYLAAR